MMLGIIPNTFHLVRIDIWCNKYQRVRWKKVEQRFAGVPVRTAPLRAVGR